MNKRLKSKKANTNKGITLIALILTIIVLLILAVVAIQAVQGDSILAHAKNARAEYQNAQNNEAATLQNYTDYIAQQSGNNPTSEDSYVKVAVNEKASANGTINGKKPSADNPIIPKGFTPINTDTSTWGDGNGAPTENSVQNGLVIKDDDVDDNGNANEFVWVSVKNINDMVMCQEQEHKTATLDSKTLECPECKKAGKPTVLAGKLYVNDSGENFGSVNPSYGKNTGRREPDVVTNASGEDSTAGSQYDAVEANITRENVLDKEHASNPKAVNFKDQLQKEFEKMAKSVAKYGGFYVGRYEMGDTGVSKKDGEALANYNDDAGVNWYGFYTKAKDYGLEKSNITSEMIWGCQYDAMMNWMQENEIDVTSETPIDTGRENSESKGTTSKNTEYTTGNEPNDRLNNVYDLLGSRSEWTQEACDNWLRVMRGGCCEFSDSPGASGEWTDPTNSLDTEWFGSRIAFYVN